MLHIVSFNVPYPADYGGVIDVYYRLRALSRLGEKVTLHCFTYGREPSPALEQWCHKVLYYPRRTGLRSSLSTKPYIVQSRRSDELVHNLMADHYPVLLEGLHCCAILEELRRRDPSRKIMVRAHNVEHEYYRRLASVEANPFRRLYLSTDARRLRRYEQVLLQADTVFAVTTADAAHFQQLGCRNVVLMPSSHADDHVVSLTGLGDYALYHADLSVGENIDAVTYLINNVFRHTDCRFIVAGRNPAPQIIQCASSHPNITVVPNPDEATMQKLISQAQVQIMVTNLPTGLKLKLLNSLYAGRHCLVNSNMVAGTELHRVCSIADSAEELRSALQRLMQTPFTDDDIRQRQKLLGSRYSNEANARILLAQI